MIFGSTPGTVSKPFAIEGDTVPALISVPGIASANIAISSLGFGQDANVQFMHTLQNRVYIYVFGERAGAVEVNGLAFYAPCKGAREGKGSGVSDLLKFYKENSVSTKEEPMSITVGDDRLTGFMHRIRSTFRDTNRGILGFSVTLMTLPLLATND